MKSPGETEDQLLYRHQFVIGPRFIDDFPSWKRLTVGPFCVTAHPDLSTCQASDGEASITLLGYILDPEEPQLGNEPIVRALASALSGGRLVSALSRLGGRWVVIGNTARETVIFNDAFGMRQVYYTRGGAEPWCAAQPGILAATLRLTVDERALGALAHCANKEFWLPGPRTLYPAIARLVPNHSLELRSGRMQRYWPNEPGRPPSLDEAVEACCSVARGLLRAAHARYPLAQTITAGWDSRMSLAASRPVSKDVLFFSMQYWNMRDDYRDLVVPAALLPRLGLAHHIVKCPDVMDPAFERVYMLNAPPAHYSYGAIAQGMRDWGLGGRLCVKSNIANILKTVFVLPATSSPSAVTAQDLLRPTWLAPSAFLIDSVDEWIRGTVPHLNGFDISELFYWEHWLGGWQAASQHEWELVIDSFDPVNSRSLMAQLLSVPRSVRSEPRNAIHRTAIEQMWPDVLSAPVNPPKKPVSLARRARQIVTGSQPYRTLRKRVAAALGREHQRAPGH